MPLRRTGLGDALDPVWSGDPEGTTSRGTSRAFSPESTLTFVLEFKESDSDLLIKTMDEKTKLILKSLIDLAASTQSDLAAVYSLMADDLPNLDETQRKQLRLKNSQQLKTI